MNKPRIIDIVLVKLYDIIKSYKDVSGGKLSEKMLKAINRQAQDPVVKKAIELTLEDIKQMIEKLKLYQTRELGHAIVEVTDVVL